VERVREVGKGRKSSILEGGKTNNPREGTQTRVCMASGSQQEREQTYLDQDRKVGRCGRRGSPSVQKGTSSTSPIRKGRMGRGGCRRSLDECTSCQTCMGRLDGCRDTCLQMDTPGITCAC
jgi:hypothetical protein